MALTYDFDMFSIIPDDVRGQFQDLFNQHGLGAASTEQVALFRNERTAAALRRADPKVQQAFLDAGFGFNVYDSGAPTGRYPASDEPARDQKLTKLYANMTRLIKSDPRLDWGGFDPVAFMENSETARPIDEVDMATAVKNAQKPRKSESRQQQNKLAKSLYLYVGGGVVLLMILSNLLTV